MTEEELEAAEEFLQELIDKAFSAPQWINDIVDVQLIDGYYHFITGTGCICAILPKKEVDEYEYKKEKNNE